MVYFSYHALSGEQSVLKWLSNRHVETEVRAELSQINLQKQALEAQNKLLRDQSLDLDYLDERVRMKLKYIHPEDMIIVVEAW